MQPTISSRENSYEKHVNGSQNVQNRVQYPQEKYVQNRAAQLGLKRCPCCYHWAQTWPLALFLDPVVRSITSTPLETGCPSVTSTTIDPTQNYLFVSLVPESKSYVDKSNGRAWAGIWPSEQVRRHCCVILLPCWPCSDLFWPSCDSEKVDTTTSGEESRPFKKSSTLRAIGLGRDM